MNEDALLAAIVRDPTDDTLRLAYADYLDENAPSGTPTPTSRALFIRHQVEISRIHAEVTRLSHSAEGLNHEMSDRYAARNRELGREIWMTLDRLWPDWHRLPRNLNVVSERESLEAPLEAGQFSIDFRRGFVWQVRCSGPDWLTDGDAIRDSEPVARVVLTAPPPLSSSTRIADTYSVALPVEPPQSGQGTNEVEAILDALRSRWPGIDFVMQ